MTDLSWFERSEVAKKIKAAQEAEILGKRKTAAEKIRAIEGEKQKILPGLRERVEAARQKVKEAQEKLENLKGETRKADTELWQERDRLEREENAQTQILFETADPRIDEAIQFLRDRHDWLADPRRLSHQSYSGETDLIREKKTITRSNVEAVRGAMEDCRKAIRILENMKLEPEFSPERVEKLKAGIRSIDVFTESVSEKNLPKMPPSHHRSDGLLKKFGLRR